MEFYGHNSHIDTINGVNEFIDRIVNSTTKSDIGSWYNMSCLNAKSPWNYIYQELAKLDSCKKIIKTKNRDEDIILFISEDISTKNIMKVNKIYSLILDNVNIFFELQVINEEELKKYSNTEKEVLWEN